MMTAYLEKVILLCLGMALMTADAFVTPGTSHLLVSTTSTTSSSPLTQLQLAPLDIMDATTSTTIAAATLDPTTALSDILAAFIGSNLILAVPIVAALAVASLIAFAIVAYANPAEPEDD